MALKTVNIKSTDAAIEIFFEEIGNYTIIAACSAIIFQPILFMKPLYFQEFVTSFSEILSSNNEFLALAAGGSWIDGRMDRFSDIDLVVVHKSQILSFEQKNFLLKRFW